LAILERLDRLEQLVRSKGGDNGSVKNSMPELGPPLKNGSPLSNLPFGPDFSTVTVETVLSWPVFRNRFDSRLDLKSLLNEPDPGSAHSPTVEAVSGEINLQLDACNRLLDSFLERVHPANPVLDVPLTRRYVREACIKGIGWDAQSCLVVRTHRLYL